ncbi:hypothetical protein NLG97_g4823 [Lecanicillium saksenae]|uniref:Uncharacterized protein n=1 Tax=Lecanicillium saksenae TaxID=468837 RepID=A0ACC1QU82_9HYPO|nr:hypothetical protein NLG97_g4823 [Lecanicillium saksenae]
MPRSSASDWPKSADQVREVLQISSGIPLLCSWITQTGNGCKRKIRADNIEDIEDLLRFVGTAGSWPGAEALLKDLSKLVLCSAHKKESDALLSLWQGCLFAAEELSDEEALSDDELQPEEPRTPPPPAGKSILRDRIEKHLKIAPASPVSYKGKRIISGPDLDNEEEMITKRRAEEVYDSTVSGLRGLSLADAKSVPSVTQQEVAPPSRKFNPFGKALCLEKINQFVKAAVQKPLTDSEIKTRDDQGSVYIYSVADDPYVKIGYSKAADLRVKKWERGCRYTTDMSGSMNVKLSRRVEGLVHGQLREWRLIQDACDSCGKMHDEWFNVPADTAIRVIGLWIRWIRLGPYNEYGFLTEKWQKKLQEVDLGDERCWEAFITSDEKGHRRRSNRAF